MTTVINFFAGSGAGKSTTAAALYAEMKQMGLETELVREYVKDWAWAGRKVGRFDQVYIFGKQVHAESKLYGLVDYVVTDSPFLLGAFYEEHYQGVTIVRPAALAFMKYANQQGIEYKNFFLERTKPFSTRGRYETEDQARKIDMALKSWLHTMEIPFTAVSVSDRERTGYILSSLGLNTAAEIQGNKPGDN